jgi:hypothetical protein
MAPPPPNKVRAKLREVARHYARARRRRGNTASIISLKRLRDLDRLFHHRYRGLALPDDDSGREDLAVALDHLKLRRHGKLGHHAGTVAN